MTAYGRHLIHLDDVLPTHCASRLSVLAKQEGGAPRRARALHSWVRIDSFAEPSLCCVVSDDCGLASFARPHGPIYYVAPGSGTIRGPDPPRQSQFLSPGRV